MDGDALAMWKSSASPSLRAARTSTMSGEEKRRRPAPSATPWDGAGDGELSPAVSATAKSAERATLSRRRRPRFPAGGATALWPPALPRAAAQGALDRGVVEVRGPDLNLQRRGALGVPGATAQLVTSHPPSCGNLTVTATSSAPNAASHPAASAALTTAPSRAAVAVGRLGQQVLHAVGPPRYLEHRAVVAHPVGDGPRRSPRPRTRRPKGPRPRWW